MTVAIGNIIQNGVVFDMKNWENSPPNADNLPAAIDRLFTTLSTRNITYLLVGGVALLSYIDGRNTQNIDFILARNDLDNLPEIIITEENKDFMRGKFDDLQIDILLTQNPLFNTVINNYVTERKFGDRLVNCVTVEGLVILKLYALPSLYRQGLFNRASIYENDLLLLFLNYPVNREEVFTILKPHLISTDLQKISYTITDIDQRIQRFRRI